MLDFINNPIVATIIKSAVVIFVLLTVFAYMTLIERVVIARIQGRIGQTVLVHLECSNLLRTASRWHSKSK